jgi:hypothetical protein
MQSAVQGTTQRRDSPGRDRKGHGKTKNPKNQKGAKQRSWTERGIFDFPRFERGKRYTQKKKEKKKEKSETDGRFRRDDAEGSGRGVVWCGSERGEVEFVSLSLGKECEGVSGR